MNTNLLNKIEKLFELNDVLVEKTYNLFHKYGLENDIYDTNSIDNNQVFSKYKRNTYREILEFKEVAVDDEKVYKLVEIRQKMLENRIATLTLDSLGTTLNITREIWNDVLVDLKRHTV